MSRISRVRCHRRISRRRTTSRSFLSASHPCYAAPVRTSWVHELEDRAERALAEGKDLGEPEFVNECRRVLADLYALDTDVIPEQREPEEE